MKNQGISQSFCCHKVSRHKTPTPQDLVSIFSSYKEQIWLLRKVTLIDQRSSEFSLAYSFRF